MAAWPVFGQKEDPAAESPDAAAMKDTCADTAQVVEFKTGSAALTPDDRAALDEVITWLQQDDSRYSRVEGWADPRGNAGKNEVLSQQRAQAVENYISSQGVDPGRVKVRARGETDIPPAPGGSERVAVVRLCSTQTAQETPPPAPAAEEPPPAEPAPPPEPAPAPPPSGMAATGISGGPAAPTQPYSVIGMGLSAGGGVIGFTDSQARDNVNDGGEWEARLTIGTRIPVGLDLAYVGSAQGLNVAGLDTNAYLLGNGAEADLRLQWPKGMFRPYAFGGVGWTHYSVQRSTVVGTALTSSDDIGTIPFGVGIAIGKVNGLLFDIRGTGRATFDDDVLSPLYSGTGQDAPLTSWAVTARLGAEW